MKDITVKNMSNLFKKELLLYAVFDIRFKRPISITTCLYVLACMTVWTLPIMWLTKSTNVWLLIFAFFPPIVLGIQFAKPIWGNKNFIDWAKANISYRLFSPKFFYDCQGGKSLKTYIADNEVLIARDRDYQYLYDLIKKERKGFFSRKKRRG